MKATCIFRRMGLNLHGFTLVEVVVVVAMIGVLTALVGTAGLHARAQSRTVNCANNLMNIGKSYALCTTESSGYMPLPYYNLAVNHKEEERIELRDTTTEDIGGLFKLTSLEEFECTEDYAPVSVLGCSTSGEDVPLLSGYGYNVFLPLCSINVARVDNPAQTVTFYDGNLLEAVGNPPFDLDWAEPSIRYRHCGRANFLYLDGHVEQHGDFRGVVDSFALRGVNFDGTVNVNPNNSGRRSALIDNEFQLMLPDGRTLDHNDLLAGDPLIGVGFADDHLEYTGPAILLKIKPKAPGLTRQVTVNSHLFDLPINRATVISGNLKVHLYNERSSGPGRGRAVGHWWISVESRKANISLELD